MQNSKSSIHIETGHFGYLLHNDRSRPTQNSIFDDEDNEVSHTAKEAYELYYKEVLKRIKKYTNRMGRSIHSKTVTHLSAIVNLNSYHTMVDLQKVADHLEAEYRTKIFQLVIHRDEGHIDNDGHTQKNYHAHIEFLGLDNEGNSIKRTLKRKQLIELQTKVAQLLNMERGINYTKEKKKRPKRLDTYDYKFHKKKEGEVVQELKVELQEAKTDKKEYIKLEIIVNNLKIKVKDKELYIASLKKQVHEVIKYQVDKRTKHFHELYEKEQIKSNYLQKQIEEREKNVELVNEEYRKMMMMAEGYLPTQFYDDMRKSSKIKIKEDQEDEIGRLEKDKMRLQEEVIHGKSKIDELINLLKSYEVIEAKNNTISILR